MYKFSANLGLLWTEMSQIDAIYKAKDKGFDAVEFQFPYQYDSREIKKALDDVNLPVMGINTIKGNIEKGDNGLLVSLQGCLRQETHYYKHLSMQK